MAECRKGFAFNDPDLTANGNWGAIITPDELRYVYAFGNDLVAPNAQVITDDTLKWYIDNAVQNVERDLKIKLLKRIYKYRPGYGETRNGLTGDEGIDYEFEEAYDFNRKEYQNYIYIKLRRRPLLSLDSVIFKDVAGNQLIDITQWVKPNYEKGSLEFFPNQGSLDALPIYLGQTFFGVTSFGAGVRNYPDAFHVDYTAGFTNVLTFRKKWGELINVVGKLAAINLLADYGDGRAAAIASSSIGLAGISESYATTMSATSAMFGARILRFWDDLKIFYKNNKDKYSGILIAAL